MSTAAVKVSTPTDCEILITRTFNAPRELVWKTLSNPELLKRWLFGPPGWTMTTCEEDQRPGGAFRWAWNGPDGAEMVMSGVYQEVVPPERVVRTEKFEFGCAPQGSEQVSTMMLAEQNDKTLLTLSIIYPSKEARDGALQSGMDRGLEAGYERLEQILAEEQSK